eukprot:362861-Chlamydomonas_euryale.AAC.2
MQHEQFFHPHLVLRCYLHVLFTWDSAPARSQRPAPQPLQLARCRGQQPFKLGLRVAACCLTHSRQGTLQHAQSHLLAAADLVELADAVRRSRKIRRTERECCAQRKPKHCAGSGDITPWPPLQAHTRKWHELLLTGSAARQQGTQSSLLACTAASIRRQEELHGIDLGKCWA